MGKNHVFFPLQLSSDLNKFVTGIYIYINDSITKREKFIVINKYTDNRSNPDDEKIIYAIKNNEITAIFERNLKFGNDISVQTFDKDSILRRFKYTMDGKFIVAG